MGWKGKTVLAVFAVALAAAIGFGVFCLYSSSKTNKFLLYFSLAVDAASDSEEGIRVETPEGWQLLQPAAYRKIFHYGSMNAMASLFSGQTNSPEAIHLKIGSDQLLIAPVKGKPDTAIVTVTIMNKRFKMKISGYELWRNLAYFTGPDTYYSAP